MTKQTKEQIKATYLRRVYGISFEKWIEMSKDGCEICGRKDGRLCVDHIHIRGFKGMNPDDKVKYVRGCLCFMCNTALKGFEKTVDGKRNRKSLEGTYQYFKKYLLKGEIS